MDEKPKDPGGKPAEAEAIRLDEAHEAGEWHVAERGRWTPITDERAAAVAGAVAEPVREHLLARHLVSADLGRDVVQIVGADSKAAGSGASSGCGTACRTASLASLVHLILPDACLLLGVLDLDAPAPLAANWAPKDRAGALPAALRRPGTGVARHLRVSPSASTVPSRHQNWGRLIRLHVPKPARSAPRCMRASARCARRCG